MLRQSDPVPSLLEQLAARAQATPSYWGQGIGVSFAMHTLAIGGYSLYLLCAAWFASADLPEWLPPQSGVRSRPQTASQAIVIEATFTDQTEQEDRPVTLKPQLANRPPAPPSLAALDTPLERETSLRPLLAQPTVAELPETVADSSRDQTPRTDNPADSPDVKVDPLEDLRPAQVPKRGHGVAVQTVSSVASVAAQESHGAETEALPHKLFSPEPEYPSQPYRDRIGGRVRIRVQLGPEGRVTNAAVFTSSGAAALDEAALQAVWQWRFEPATSSRRTVRELIVPIRFIPPGS